MIRLFRQLPLILAYWNHLGALNERRISLCPQNLRHATFLIDRWKMNRDHNLHTHHSKGI